MSGKRNIVLMGFMGSGKTSVGKKLAERLDMTFVDMDDVIVQRRGKSISDIFDQDGEAYFRSLERNLVRELSAESGKIIATGGGIVLNPQNVSDFEAGSLVVCLSASPEAILERVKDDTNRPLLADGDKLGKIKSILDKRIKLYKAVSNQLPTDGLTVEEVVEKVIELYIKG